MTDDQSPVRVNWTAAERHAYTGLMIVLIGWLALGIAAAAAKDDGALWILFALWSVVVALNGWAARETSRLATSSVPDAAIERAALVARVPAAVCACGLGVWMLVQGSTVPGVGFLVIGAWQFGAILRRQALR